MADELEFEGRMNASDALMWNIEKDPMLRSTIVAVALLDRAPARDRLTARIDRATRLVPRMRQRVISSPMSVAPPRWAVDPNFDLEYHLRFVKAPGQGTMRELLHLAEPIAMQGFDRARPLWEMVVVDGLEDGRAAIVQKLHHAITDGVGGIQIAMHMVDLERDPADADEEPLPEPPLPEEWGYLRRMANAASYETTRQLHRLRRTAEALPRGATDPVGAVHGAFRTIGSIARLLQPATEPMSPVMRGRSLSVRFDTLSISLPDLKAAAKSAGGKLNDAFVASVTGGLRRYHEHHGVPVEKLRMNMPISIRDEATRSLAGNQFVPARFPVPIDIEEPVERMVATRDLVHHERAEPALQFTGAIADLLNRLPTSVTTQIFGDLLRGIDFTTSNVPGIPMPVYIGGAKLESLTPFAPLAGAATNIALVSYLDDLHVGVNMDPVAIPDHHVFMGFLRDGFDEVLKVGQ